MRWPLRAGGWPDEPSGAGLPAPNQGLDGATANPLPLVDAESVAVEQILAAHCALVGQVDDPQVGVEAGRDVPLFRETEPPSDVRGGDGREGGRLEAALREEGRARRVTR